MSSIPYIFSIDSKAQENAKPHKPSTRSML